jgi:uncharacterized protein YutE (UPF0331/DUF86 family)
VVERKLQALRGYLDELAAVVPSSRQEYLDDALRRRAAERLLQLVIEVAVDINAHVGAESGVVPDDGYHSFLVAADVGLLPSDLAHRLAPSAGLRNRLVHEYEAVDDTLVFSALEQARVDYPAYLRAVLTYLSGSAPS